MENQNTTALEEQEALEDKERMQKELRVLLEEELPDISDDDFELQSTIDHNDSLVVDNSLELQTPNHVNFINPSTPVLQDIPQYSNGPRINRPGRRFLNPVLSPLREDVSGRADESLETLDERLYKQLDVGDQQQQLNILYKTRVRECEDFRRKIETLQKTQEEERKEWEKKVNDLKEEIADLRGKELTYQNKHQLLKDALMEKKQLEESLEKCRAQNDKLNNDQKSLHDLVNLLETENVDIKRRLEVAGDEKKLHERDLKSFYEKEIRHLKQILEKQGQQIKDLSTENLQYKTQLNCDKVQIEAKTVNAMQELMETKQMMLLERATVVNLKESLDSKTKELDLFKIKADTLDKKVLELTNTIQKLEHIMFNTYEKGANKVCDSSLETELKRCLDSLNDKRKELTQLKKLLAEKESVIKGLEEQNTIQTKHNSHRNNDDYNIDKYRTKYKELHKQFVSLQQSYDEECKKRMEMETERENLIKNDFQKIDELTDKYSHLQSEYLKTKQLNLELLSNLDDLRIRFETLQSENEVNQNESPKDSDVEESLKQLLKDKEDRLAIAENQIEILTATVKTKDGFLSTYEQLLKESRDNLSKTVEIKNKELSDMKTQYNELRQANKTEIENLKKKFIQDNAQLVESQKLCEALKYEIKLMNNDLENRKSNQTQFEEIIKDLKRDLADLKSVNNNQEKIIEDLRKRTDHCQICESKQQQIELMQSEQQQLKSELVKQEEQIKLCCKLDAARKENEQLTSSKNMELQSQIKSMERDLEILRVRLLRECEQKNRPKSHKATQTADIDWKEKFELSEQEHKLEIARIKEKCNSYIENLIDQKKRLQQQMNELMQTREIEMTLLTKLRSEQAEVIKRDAEWKQKYEDLEREKDKLRKGVDKYAKSMLDLYAKHKKVCSEKDSYMEIATYLNQHNIELKRRIKQNQQDRRARRSNSLDLTNDTVELDRRRPQRKRSSSENNRQSEVENRGKYGGSQSPRHGEGEINGRADPVRKFYRKNKKIAKLLNR